MKKLFLLKKGNMIFYACLWDFGGYSIERITKAVGFTVKAFDTLENLEKYASENGYKKAIQQPWSIASGSIPGGCFRSFLGVLY